ncbi:MAG: group I truncated hemoglobin [Oleiphilus sp.]
MNMSNPLKMLSSIVKLGALLAMISACASHQQSSLYQQIGGQQTVEQLSDAFIAEIQYDKQTLSFFLDSDIDRFRSKFIEHICATIDGPCEYTGDDMTQVHKGMNITEADFNRVVELLINAMTNVDIPHRLQNQILARLAPMRGEMIYH